jgi:PAS domain S-box-containing protein
MASLREVLWPSVASILPEFVRADCEGLIGPSIRHCCVPLNGINTMLNDSSRSTTSQCQDSVVIAPELLRQALNGVPTAIYIKNHEHRLIFVNAACGALLHQSPADLLGKEEAAIFPASLAQGWPAADEGLLATIAAIAPTFSFQLTLPVGAAHRLTRWAERTTDNTGWICFLETAEQPSAARCHREVIATAWTMPQLQALLANVPAVIYQLHRQADGHTQFAFVSPGAFEVFGIPSERLKVDVDHLLPQIHPLDRFSFEQTLATSAETLTPWRWEGRYYKPSGKLGWVQTAARPGRLPDGTVQWDGLLMDITSRKKVEAATIEQAVMEQALADNETRFRTITDTIPGALIQFRVQDDQLFVDFVSDRIEDITGLSPVAIMANAQLFLERLHPVDSQRLRVKVKQALVSRQAWQFEGRIRMTDGTSRWWHLDAMPVPQSTAEAVFCGVVLDVTDRREIEDAYRENDRQLRMAMNVSGMGVWTWDMATDAMHWTTEPGTLFEETAIRCCDTFDLYLQNVHPDDRQTLKTAVSQALAAGQDYEIEYRLQLSDQSICWVGEHGGIWRDPDGFVLGLMGTVTDITHRKTAETALQDSEERYRTLIHNIPGAVYRCQVDPNWTLLFQSETIANITGYPAAHPIYQQDWRILHPADRERVEQDITIAIAECRSFETEYRIFHADGSIRWVVETGQPITDATGIVRYIDGVLTDITRRKESETRLQELAQRQGLINHISTQIRNSLELTPILQTTVQTIRSQLATDRVVVYCFRESWMGAVLVEDVARGWPSTLGEIGADDCFPSGAAQSYEAGRVCTIPNIYEAGLDACHVTFLESLRVQASLIVPIHLKDRLWGLLIAHECRGPRKWTAGEVELLVALAGQVGLAIGQAHLYRQATENAERARQQAADLKTTLDELQRTQAKLVQTEKMSSLGQLVAGVAHEINNPVSFIDGNILHASEYTQDLLHLIAQYQATYPNPPHELAQLIRNIDLDFLASDFPKLLESMRVGAERIKSIVNSLRTFSRMDEAEIKAVNIHDGLDSTLMILQHRFKANGDRPAIKLVCDYGDLPLVECYAGQLNQVFMNLISNAIDAIEEQLATDQPPSPPTVTIKTVCQQSDAVRITITDNGPGISDRTRPHIFEPFYTTKPIGKGTGIGLSISYQIIHERHHGTLEFESQSGSGTAFHITIPVYQGIT